MRLTPCLAGAMLLTAGSARAADVAVTVSGVRNAHGKVLVALCSQADFLHPHCTWKAHAAARPGVVHVTITGVPPGTYAAQAFHDENGNGRLDRNFLGLPREGMGFSRDAPMHYGPPRFDSAAFPVTATGASISFALRYYDSR